jgi:serine protease Do
MLIMRNKKSIAAIVIIILIILIFNYSSAQSDIEESRYTAITRAIEKVSPAVASINVIQVKEFQTSPLFNDPFFRNFFPYELHRERVKSSGSGVVVSPDGYVITNYHVIENALEIIVTLPGGEEYEAEIIGTDRMTDLSILKLAGRNFPYAEIGNSDELMIGEWVVALGNPYGLFDVNDQPSATAGIVSALNMDFGKVEAGRTYQDMIQTDAAINPGNSGGPLVNSLGQVIGINTFIFTGSGYSQGSIGIGFAIPINKAKTIAEELKVSGRIDRSYATGLQVQPINERIARYLDIPFTRGVIVVEVEPNSTADRVGIKAADVIVSVNGERVNNANDIKNIISNNDLRPGDQLQLRIFRDGDYLNVQMTLGSIENDLR